MLCVCLHVCTQLCPTFCEPMDCSPPGSSSMGFPRREYWSGLPFPSPGDLLHPGIKPASLACLALAGRFFTTEPLGTPLHFDGNDWKARLKWTPYFSPCSLNSSPCDVSSRAIELLTWQHNSINLFYNKHSSELQDLIFKTLFSMYLFGSNVRYKFHTGCKQYIPEKS